MSFVVELLARLRADNRNMVQGFQQAGQSAQGMGKIFQDAAGRWHHADGKFVASADRIRMGLKNVGEEAKATGTKAANSGSSIQQAFAFVKGGALLGGLYALGNGMQSLGMMGLQAASDQQQAMIAFEHMLGSAKAAQVYMEELNRLAAETPFELSDVVLGTKRLMGYGFEAQNAKRMLTAMGDAASALSTGAEGIAGMTLALGQMRAKGKIAQQELTQMAGYGVPALQYLADSFSVTTGEMQDMLTAGLVPAEEGIEAIVTGMEKGTKNAKGFGGMMKVQSESLAGVWSTFMDELQLGLANALMPYVPAMTAVVKAATPLLTVVLGGLMRGVAVVVGGIGKMIDAAKKFGGAMGGDGPAQAIQTLVVYSTWLKMRAAPAFDAIAAKVKEAMAIAGPALMRFGSAIIVNVVPVIAKLADFVMTYFVPAFAKLLPPLARLGAAIMDGLVPALGQAKDTFMVDLLPALRMLGEFLQNYVIPYWAFLIDALVPVVQVIGWVLPYAIKAVVMNFKIAIGILAGFVLAIRWVVQTVGGGMGQLVAFFRSLPGRIMAELRALPGLVWGLLKMMASGALRSVGQMIGAIVLLFTRGPGLIMERIRSLPGRVIGMFNLMKSRSVASLRALWTGIVWVVQRIRSAVVSWFSSTVSSGVRVISRMPGQVMRYIRGLPGQIKGAFSTAGSWLVSAGRAIVRGLWNGIREMGGWLYGKVSSFVKSNIQSGINSVLKFGSPSRTATQWGRWVSQGLGAGMLAEGHKVSGASRVVAAKALPSRVPAAAGPPVPGPRGAPVLEIRGDGTDISEFLIRILRQAIRTRGGDVEVVLTQ